jgi:hypothetical protein
MKQEDKKETAMRRLSKALRKRFQGPLVNISWIELDAFMMKAQTWELENILNAYSEGYSDSKNGLPNKAENESNTNV